MPNETSPTRRSTLTASAVTSTPIPSPGITAILKSLNPQTSDLVNMSRPWEAGTRQREPEAGAAIGRHELKRAAMGLRDAKREREPETGPGPHGLGREERLEHPPCVLRRDARPSSAISTTAVSTFVKVRTMSTTPPLASTIACCAVMTGENTC